jgi:hypothetical protein
MRDPHYNETRSSSTYLADPSSNLLAMCDSDGVHRIASAGPSTSPSATCRGEVSVQLNQPHFRPLRFESFAGSCTAECEAGRRYTQKH